MMRKLTQFVALIALAAGICAPAIAQTTSQAFPQKVFYASDYGTWSILGQSANTYSFFPSSICQVPSAGSPATFNPFNTNAPVWVKDVTAANSEVLTPSAVSTTSCGITIAPANNHYSFSLLSGTGGLQEVLNQISASNAYPAVVFLDRNWYTAAASVPSGSPRAMIAAAKGSAQAILVDNTTSPWTYYTWSNTTAAYVNSGVTGGATAPTGAVGGATIAGTGAAITVTGNGNEGTVKMVTGTGISTTGTFFTLTWPSSGSFTTQAKACGVAPVGTPTVAATQAISGTTTTVDTVTTTANAVVSTTYLYTYNCQAGQ